MKTIKKVSIVSLFLVLCFTSYAQQEAQYSMYMFNPLAVNPAYAGSRDALSITALHRSQWVGLKGAPKTQTLSIHSPLKYESVGLGFSVVNDQIGVNKNTGVYADFAYRIRVNRKNDKIAFGLKAGVDFFNSDYRDLEVMDNTDELYQTPIQNLVLPNFGFGIYYYGDKFYLGATVPHLLENDLSSDQSLSEAIQNRHMFLMAGYVFTINSAIDFKPSVVVKMVNGAPLSADINASFYFYKKLWLGAMYRPGSALGVNVVYDFTDFFRVGYAFDFTTNAISNYSNGSHEVMLGFDLKTSAKSFRTPRYF